MTQAAKIYVDKSFFLPIPSTIWNRITNDQFYFYFVIVAQSIKRSRVPRT